MAAEPRRPPLGATSPPELEVSDCDTFAHSASNLRAQGPRARLARGRRPPRARVHARATTRSSTQLGQLASVAIANARLYDRERTIARTLQRSLRPGALPDVPGLAAAVRFNAAGEGVELGGDFYDLYRARDGGWAALIGDIQGKGPEAAAVTALARHTLRAAAAYEHRPSGVLTLLHRALREQVVRRPLLHRRLRLHAGRPGPRAARAGLRRAPAAADRAPRRHASRRSAGSARCWAPTPTRCSPTSTVELESGDVLVLYTDGVTEVRRQRREVFGTEQLIELLQGCGGLQPRRGRRARRARRCMHASMGRLRDDMAVLALGPRPETAPRLHAADPPRRRSHPQRRAMADTPDATATDGHGEATEGLLRELVSHLRANRTQLREEWARRISEARLLTALTQEEIFAEATSIYDSYVEVLETGSVEALQDYARNLSERIIPRGVEVDEVVGIVLLLRDVLARSLFEKYQSDFDLLNRVLDAYEPAANRIANTVAGNFVGERERVIRQQQEAIRELSTPVLQVRERLLILPIIGVLDGQRARQLTEQLLRGIRANRAKVVVIDITGVPTIDSTVANHLVQTVEASRLMGASVIITGLSSDIAQTLVTLGVDLSKVNAVGDLQGGIEEAERLLGYEVTQGDYLATEAR